MENFLFILIDKLGYRQVPLYWDKHNLTPTMHRLAQSGIFCSNYFTQGCVTQFSMPSILTSTFPLDYGGYDDGIMNRPTAFMETLQEKGYQTIGFFPSAIGRPEGYDRGFDKYYVLCDIELCWRQIPYLCNYYDKIIDKEKKISVFYLTIQKILFRYYTNIIEYCENKLIEKQDSFYRKSRIYNHDFEKIKSLLGMHLEQLNKAPNAYIDQNIEKIKNSTGIENFFGICRWNFYNFLPKKITKNTDIGNSYFKINPWEKNAPAGFMTDLSIKWLKDHGDQPFAMFLHYMNVHEKEFGDGLLQVKLDRTIYNSNKEAYQNNRKYYYDLAANYTDKCISRLLTNLEKLNLLDHTYVVITSDHGDIPEFPSSPFPLPKLPGGAFSDDYHHVPLIFWHKKMKPKLIEGMHSSLDIAPTICDLLGIEKPTVFNGTSILKKESPSEYVYAEHTYSGPCDLDNKPIYLSIRSNSYKFIWKEYIYQGDENSVDLEEFFDLEKDQGETENLINDSNYQSIISKMRTLAEKRFQEIRVKNALVI